MICEATDCIEEATHWLCYIHAEAHNEGPDDIPDREGDEDDD